MQMLMPMLWVLPVLAMAGCAVAESTTSPAPTGLEGKLTVLAASGASRSARIELRNPTDAPRASGRFKSFTLTRTDVTPPAVVASSPAHAMSPHVRVMIPPHESRSSELTFWEKGEALPAGRYHLEVSYPPDVLAGVLTADFEVATSGGATSHP